MKINGNTTMRYVNYLLLLVFINAYSSVSVAQDRVLRFGTGSESNIYYHFGLEVSDAVANSGVDNFSLEVISTDGSIDNLQQMAEGNLDLAIVQNDIAYYVYEGNRGFTDFQNFKAGIPLFAEYIQVLVRPDKTIRTLGDLAGKTVSIGPESSGSYQNALDLLSVAGLRSGVDFEPVYFNSSDAISKLTTGDIDAIIKTEAVFPQLGSSSSTGIHALSLSREIVGAMTLRSPYYVAVNPTVKFDHFSTEISTISVTAYLVFSDRVASNEAKAIVSAIEHQLSELQSITGNYIELAPIQEADLRKPVPLHSGVRSYLLAQGYVASNAAQYWGIFFGILVVAIGMYSQSRCNAYDRLGNIRTHSGGLSSRFYLTVSRFYGLIVVLFIFVCFLIFLIEAIQYFETEYARRNNIRNQFADVGFWDALLWMFMFMGSGHTENMFPLSDPGKVLVTALPFVGIGGILGSCVLALDTSRAKRAARKRGRLPTRARNHVLICGWNEKAKGIVYNLTNDDVPKRKHVVVVAEIDGDMPLENHDFDPTYVSYQRGDSADHDVLARANIKHADAAVVVAGLKKRAGKNIRSILSVMALKEAHAKETASNPNKDNEFFVAAELLYKENKPIFHACGADAVITADLVADRMAAQSCISKYIVDFVLDALTYDDASELYSTRVKNIGVSNCRTLFLPKLLSKLKTYLSHVHPPLRGKKLSHVRKLLASQNINVVAAAKNRSYDDILVDNLFDDDHYMFPQNPTHGEIELTDDHVLLFFADDHSAINRAARRTRHEKLSTQNCNSDERLSIHVTPTERRVLLVGDWRRCKLVQDMLNQTGWCTSRIFVESLPQDVPHSSNVTVGSFTVAENWRKAGILEVDQVTILSQTGERINTGQDFDEHGEIDARAIFTSKFARRHYRQLTSNDSTPSKAPLIAAEMLGHKSRPLFHDAEVDIVIPSNLIVERMLTKLVYSKGAVCRFLMALLAFDDGRHIMTITLDKSAHAVLLNRTFEELMFLLPAHIQILGILPENPKDRDHLTNTVPDFAYHVMTSPNSFGLDSYKCKNGDQIIVMIDQNGEVEQTNTQQRS